MAINCTSLDKAAGQVRDLCFLLAPSVKTFDGAEKRIDYTTSGFLPKGVPADGKLDITEILHTYAGFKVPTHLQNAANVISKRILGYDKPWIADTKHKQHVETAVRTAKSMIQKYKGTKSSTQVVADAIFKAIKLPESQGGLGIIYRNHLLAEGDINEVIDRGYARCSEFVYVFTHLANELGLKTYPVQVPQRFTGDPSQYPHYGVLVIDKKTNERFFIDSQFKEVMTESPYDTYYVGTPSDLFGIYLYNKSMVTGDDGISIGTKDDSPLLKAELIAPYNDIVLYGLGVYHYAREEYEAALKYFRKTTNVNPNHAPSWNYLCAMTLDEIPCQKKRHFYPMP